MTKKPLRFNYGQNSKIASTAESSLATAEARKVFFPFGVGLTAAWYPSAHASVGEGTGKVSRSFLEVANDLL